MEIGKINQLKVLKIIKTGCYLVDNDNIEAFLPNTHDSDILEIDDEIEVFIYKDSEDQLIATTSKPYIQLHEFAFLKAKEINPQGAFLDWGIPKKDLRVPYNEQAGRMEEENWYLVFMFKDEETGRLIGSNKINKFVFADASDVNQGDEVELLLYKMTDLGMNAIVNNKYKGLIFSSDIHKNVHVGDKIKGYVKQVREDGKIDLLLEPLGYKSSIDSNSNIILTALKENEGFLNLTDKSSPEDIKHTLGLSKKAFKKGLGNLYKQKIIELYNDGIKLL